ncbi:Uncharacterised protein [uncultured archaeon]|nr:Uncharacterised protein [uncultured archaeon]
MPKSGEDCFGASSGGVGATGTCRASANARSSSSTALSAAFCAGCGRVGSWMETAGCPEACTVPEVNLVAKSFCSTLCVMTRRSE